MISQTIQSMLTLAKVAIKSKWFLPKFKAHEKEVVVIANGPSARAFIDQCNQYGIQKMRNHGIEFFAVNKFSCQPEFFQLKPKYYLMR